jgi:hypothetical protein
LLFDLLEAFGPGVDLLRSRDRRVAGVAESQGEPGLGSEPADLVAGLRDQPVTGDRVRHFSISLPSDLLRPDGVNICLQKVHMVV